MRTSPLAELMNIYIYIHLCGGTTTTPRQLLRSIFKRKCGGSPGGTSDILTEGLNTRFTFGNKRFKEFVSPQDYSDRSRTRNNVSFSNKLKLKSDFMSVRPVHVTVFAQASCCVLQITLKKKKNVGYQAQLTLASLAIMLVIGAISVSIRLSLPVRLMLLYVWCVVCWSRYLDCVRCVNLVFKISVKLSDFLDGQLIFLHLNLSFSFTSSVRTRVLPL